MEKVDRIFTKMTERGTTSLIVREQYLRDDIPCLAIGCPVCPQSNNGASSPGSPLPFPPSPPASTSQPCSLYPSFFCVDHPDFLVARLAQDASHFVIPDTQVCSPLTLTLTLPGSLSHHLWDLIRYRFFPIFCFEFLGFGVVSGDF